MTTKKTALTKRREIFMALVTTQDQGRSVRESYEVIAEQFGISATVLREIEDEGVEKEWPPLSEAEANEPIIVGE